MRNPGVVLQELWAIKDAEFQQAGSDGKRLVEQLRQRSASLRAGLQLKPLLTTKPAIGPGDKARCP